MDYWKEELMLLGLKVFIVLGVVFGIYKFIVDPALKALQAALETGFGVMNIF